MTDKKQEPLLLKDIPKYVIDDFVQAATKVLAAQEPIPVTDFGTFQVKHHE